ncbi:E3 ubiquitin-protein ligase XBAT33-like [Zingiber officinale]|uniref:E3 ubiquitin-protein ligase XBAT33-like n=1 Tax=Zingiber officinale TaxID=94328 RepID=UPI001C4C9758|nr:E3 ubiquitin-protein ligase XBAT33-like [Zingiber officinale]
MGNLLGCSAAGERLVTAARDGDVIEAQKLVEMNPGLARYSTFAGLSSPLHAAAARGHAEIVMMLLEKGADLNLRNICGQTPLMEACCSGRWEVVQTLLLYRCNVSKVEFLSGRTALHFAAAGGHARCIRLLAADVYPGFPLSAITNSSEVEQVGDQHKSLSAKHYDPLALTRFINKAAKGGITALHLAALNGHSNCVHLLLDLNANISAMTLSCASSTITIGSTPLHYAACGGNLKCCQILLSRGADRSTINSNGWLPVDVARSRGSHRLIPLLTPHSSQLVPAFPPSNYLPLPLMSILQIARVNGLNSSTSSCDESDLCAVCLERTCTVAAAGCGHELCTKCALCLCSTSSINSEMSAPPGSVPCPLCRAGIVSFVSLPTNEIEAGQDIGLCGKCHGLIHGRCQNSFATACGSELCMNPFEVVPPAVCEVDGYIIPNHSGFDV